MTDRVITLPLAALACAQDNDSYEWTTSQEADQQPQVLLSPHGQFILW